MREALGALRAERLVVYPTETFYGLGADATSSAALERLFRVKRRDAHKPVALIVAGLEMAQELASGMPRQAYRLAEAFWPGPLTIVLPARPGLHPGLVGPDGGVGVRVSSHPVARELVRAFGKPLTATSANLAGEPPAKTVAAARAAFGNRVKVYLEGGLLQAPAPSSVVAFEGGDLRVLREGAIGRDRLAAAVASEALK